jgi:hypothetical protein
MSAVKDKIGGQPDRQRIHTQPDHIDDQDTAGRRGAPHPFRDQLR